MHQNEEILLKNFVSDYIKHSEFSIYILPGSGSERKNYIVQTSDSKYILTYNKRIEENESFFYLTESFLKLDLPVPEIFKINKERTLYLQEYLGEKTLSQIIDIEVYNSRIHTLVKNVILQLSHFQNKTLGKINFEKSYEFQEYNHLPILHDLYYFKNFFADVLEIDYHKGRLLKEFETIVQEIENLQPKTVMMRDFQARNIMVNSEDRLFFIDYQAAMWGPATYDLVSFLFQAKANFPTTWQEEFLDLYYQLNQDKFDINGFRKNVNYCKLIRYLQVLGAYGFRGLIQQKEHFLKSIPRGIQNIIQLSNEWEEMKKYPELSKLISRLKTLKYNNLNTK